MKYIKYILICIGLFLLVCFADSYSQDSEFSIIEKEIINAEEMAEHDVKQYCEEHQIESYYRCIYLKELLALHRNKRTHPEILRKIHEGKLVNQDIIIKNKIQRLLFQETITRNCTIINTDSVNQIFDSDDSMINELEKNTSKNKKLIYLLCSIILSICVCAIDFFTIYNRKNKEIMFLRSNIETTRKSIKKYINEIDKIQNEAKKNQTPTYTESLHKINETFILKSSIFKKEQIAITLSLIKKNDCAVRFIRASKDGRISINHDNWSKLSDVFTNELPYLTYLLTETHGVTNTERRVCMLMLLDLETLEISNAMNIQPSTVSSAKKSLYEKLTNSKGSAKDLKQSIINALINI